MITFEEIKKSGVILIKNKSFSDNRGYFFENYNYNKFKTQKIKKRIVQNNVSFSKKGVIRGLHYQTAPYQQAKIVSVLKGKVLDVALDIRKNSKSYLKNITAILSDKNKHALFIPEGFAHGFQVLSDYAIVSYMVTNKWSKDHEKTLCYKKYKIKWKKIKTLISNKDLEACV